MATRTKYNPRGLVGPSEAPMETACNAIAVIREGAERGRVLCCHDTRKKHGVHSDGTFHWDSRTPLRLRDLWEVRDRFGSHYEFSNAGIRGPGWYETGGDGYPLHDRALWMWGPLWAVKSMARFRTDRYFTEPRLSQRGPTGGKATQTKQPRRPLTSFQRWMKQFETEGMRSTDIVRIVLDDRCWPSGSGSLYAYADHLINIHDASPRTMLALQRSWEAYEREHKR